MSVLIQCLDKVCRRNDSLKNPNQSTVTHSHAPQSMVALNGDQSMRSSHPTVMPRGWRDEADKVERKQACWSSKVASSSKMSCAGWCESDGDAKSQGAEREAVCQGRPVRVAFQLRRCDWVCRVNRQEWQARSEVESGR